MSVDHRHKKSLGQHFLHERGVVERIVAAIDPRPGERIVEIGPGAGALTLPLLDRHGALAVIEFDRDLIEPLRSAAASHGVLELIQADALGIDFTTLAAGDRLRLVGNLPYNISTPILFHVLAHTPAIADMHFMLQREVVERMCAVPGSKVYGRLSVMLQAVCVVTSLFRVAPGSFTPPPKVDSAMVRLVPKSVVEVGISDAAVFERTVRLAFGQRRKTLRNALSGHAGSIDLVAAGIDPGARAETVAVARFVELANLLASRPD